MPICAFKFVQDHECGNVAVEPNESQPDFHSFLDLSDEENHTKSILLRTILFATIIKYISLMDLRSASENVVILSKSTVKMFSNICT